MNKNNCRGCNSTYLKPVISLGLSPLANNLLDSLEDQDNLYPLEMVYCSDCHNCQLSYIVPAGEMFDHYLYVSSTVKSFRDHFEQAAKKYIKDFNLNSDSFVIDIGSNDGIALKPLKERGVQVLGFEPAKNIAEIALNNGIPTINEYFTIDSIKNVINKADIITASNVFAHADGLEEIAHTAFSLLKPEGCFIVEVQYLLDTIKDLTFDNIYHEHVNYWSVTAINNFFNRLGYSVSKVEHINTHGGSTRVYIKNKGSEIDSSVSKFLQNEKEFGLTNYSIYLEFAKRVEQAKTNTNNNIKSFKDKGLTLVGYGSPAKATTSLNYCGVKDIDYIIEDNTLKHNKILPGVKIPIYSKNKLYEKLPDIIIVMAWNFVEEIKKNNQDLIDKGIKFISIKELQNEN
jgi:SAM-dependent methyltransferase